VDAVLILDPKGKSQSYCSRALGARVTERSYLHDKAAVSGLASSVEARL